MDLIHTLFGKPGSLSPKEKLLKHWYIMLAIHLGAKYVTRGKKPTKYYIVIKEEQKIYIESQENYNEAKLRKEGLENFGIRVSPVYETDGNITARMYEDAFKSCLSDNGVNSGTFHLPISDTIDDIVGANFISYRKG